MSVVLITCALLEVGAAPLILWQFLTGSWIFILMFRRPCFRLLSRVFVTMKAEEEEIEREIREREEAGKELPPLVLQVPKPRSPNNVYACAGHRVLADPVERVSPRSNLRGSVSLPALQTRS